MTLLLRLADVSISLILMVFVLAFAMHRRAVPETVTWWRWINIYYELRPFILPLLALATVIDTLQHDSAYTLFIDVLSIPLWHWLMSKDPPDPRDRWGKRRKAVRRLLTQRPQPKTVTS